MGDCNCKHGASGAGGVCIECDIPHLARNNYFTGKLLVERDFTDEQRYLLGKSRRHNQRLHGWGAVCGLKVKPHPNCPDRFVIIEPGTALDCCGREILVSRDEYFDFEAQFLANWQKQNGPNSQPDPNVTYKIQICVSYKECCTEDIPALFDDCSCDATSCQPNRILESFGFDVLMPSTSAGVDTNSAQLRWSNTLHFANAVRVAESEATKRLYILTSSTSGGSSTATLYQLDTSDYNVLASATIANSAGLDVAVSPAGDFVYVAVQPTTPGAAPQINVFSSSSLAAAVSQFKVGTGTDPTVHLGVVPAPDGRLLVIGKTIGAFAVSGMNVAAPPPKVTAILGITNPVALAISPGGQYAYVATGSANISWITLSSPPAVGSTSIAVGTPISSIAIAGTTKGDTLAALDTASQTLYFVSIPTAGPTGPVVVTTGVTGFKFPPSQVLMSHGGKWAFVLEQETATSKGYVQAINEHAVETNQPGNPLGAAMQVGIAPVSEEISEDGAHLYIPFTGQAQTDNGGVAVLDVLQTKCCDLFQHVIDGCPDCTDGNCIILATINNYTYGQPVGVGVADIDNLIDRRLLVSTDVLTQVVQCLCEQGGSAGAAAQAGQIGPAGPGLETGLVRIHALSWNHGGTLKFSDVLSIGGAAGTAPLSGFVIAFSDFVQTPSSSDAAHIFQVVLDPQALKDKGQSFQNLCVILGSVIPVTATFSPTNANLVTGATSFSSPPPAKTQALAFLFDPKMFTRLVQSEGADFDVWIRLHGDFLLDTTGKAVSADFVRAQFDTGERPQGTGLCLEGGTFESWLLLTH